MLELVNSIRTEVILECIPERHLKEYKQHSPHFNQIGLFVNKLSKKTGKTPDELYQEIIIAYLNEVFTFAYDLEHENFVLVHTQHSGYLIESDPMFRLIQELHSVETLTGRIFGANRKFIVIPKIFELFKERPLFQYFKQINCNTFEILFYLRLIRTYFSGDVDNSFYTIAGGFPLSEIAHLLYRIDGHVNTINKNNLACVDYMGYNNICVFVKPKLIRLAANQIHD